MSSIRTLLDEEIKSELEEFKKMELGSDDYKSTSDVLTKLIDRHIELEKVENERRDKIESRNTETSLKLEQMEDDRKDRKVKNGIAIFGIVVPVGVTIWGTLKSLKFEETGSVSTIMGRGFIQKLLPKLK
jgi:hypothetical protein